MSNDPYKSTIFHYAIRPSYSTMAPCAVAKPVLANDFDRKSDTAPPKASRAFGAAQLLQGLSWLDRLLAVFVLLAMILGVVIGTYMTDMASAQLMVRREICKQCGGRPARRNPQRRLHPLVL